MNNLLIIRVDVTSETGIGHVMRCLALAQEWKANSGPVVFIGTVEDAYVRDRFVKDRFQFIDMKADASDGLSTDVGKLISIVKDRLLPAGPDGKIIDSRISNRGWIVLDGYHFGTEYQQALTDFGFRILVNDDTAHLPHYRADILLNQNLHAENLNYPCDPKTIFLLGSKYVLLRREFLKSRKRKRSISQQVKNILITCGGVDSKNITQKAIAAVKQLGMNDLVVRIVIGPKNPHVERLAQELRNVPFRCELLFDVRDMASLMEQADLAITASGSTCWELTYMGVPFLTSILSDNQEKVALSLDQAGVSRCLGWWDEIEESNIEKAITALMDRYDLRVETLRKANDLVDGLGTRRVCHIMNLVSGEKTIDNLMLRNVTPGDNKQLFRLANNPKTRKSSFNPDPINMENHLKWFNQKLGSRQHTSMWVLEYEDLIVAQIRYDRIDGRTAEVDYSVHPALRQRGMGKAILERTLFSACRQLKVDHIKGVVFEHNVASRQCFLKAGFTENDKVVIAGNPCVQYGLNVPLNDGTCN